MTDATTPKMGDNTGIDYAKETTEALKRDYPNVRIQVDELKTEARLLYAEPVTDDNKGAYVSLIKRIRDVASKFDALRVAEKEPYLRRGQGVDQFFLGPIDELSKRDAKSRRADPGVADHLQKRLDDFVDQRERERRAELLRQQEEADRKAREDREKAAKAAADAEAARLAAERARKPEHVETKTEAAQQQEAKADLANVQAIISEDRLFEATTAAAAKPSDLVRERLDDGAMLTGRKVGYADITDESKLDKELLWPHISIEAKEKALNSWAKANAYKVEMAGAAIGHRTKAVGR